MDYFQFQCDQGWSYPPTKEGLEEARGDGCYPVIKQFIENLPELIDDQTNYSRHRIFLNACCKGNTELVKWMMDECPSLLKLDNIESVFMEICTCGKIHIAHLLCDNAPFVDVRCDGDYPFLTALWNRHYDICTWIFGLHPEMKKDLREYFNTICQFGDLDACKFLYSLDSSLVTIQSYNISHMYEHKKLVEWMVDVFCSAATCQTSEDICSICYDHKVDMLTRCNHGFCKSCMGQTMITTCSETCPYCRQKMLPFK